MENFVATGRSLFVMYEREENDPLRDMCGCRCQAKYMIVGFTVPYSTQKITPVVMDMKTGELKLLCDIEPFDHIEEMND